MSKNRYQVSEVDDALLELGRLCDEWYQSFYAVWAQERADELPGKERLERAVLEAAERLVEERASPTLT